MHLCRLLSLEPTAGLAGLACAILVLAAAPASARSEPAGGISWPKGQALPTFAAARRLDVVDIERIPGAEQLLFTSLQGVVNRREPRIYLLTPSDEGKQTWLRNGLGVPYTVRPNAWTLLERYRKEVKGVVVYDPAVPDTINVATTLAGLKDAVVASPSLLPRLTRAPYRLPVLNDLRGRFRTRLEAYRWQYETLWPRTTHRMLVALSPTRSVEVRPTTPDNWRVLLEEGQPIRDASNRETRELDLTPYTGKGAVYLRFQDSHPDDGWGGAVHEVAVRVDGREVARFVPGTNAEKAYLYDPGGSAVNAGSGGHRFVDGGGSFVYRFLSPVGTKRMSVSLDIWNQFQVSAMDRAPGLRRVEEPYGYLRDYAVANRAMVFWLDPNIAAERRLLEQICSKVAPYTPYLGWFAQDVAGEFGGTELVSRHGVYVLAADWYANMTVFSGARAANRPPKAPPAPKLENKIYATFVMSEGDNLQYNQHRMRRLWDDAARGSVPITWTSTPLLLDAAPSILSYYQRTASENDVLIAGPSGAGYIYPTPWPDETFGVFARETARYMRRTGMTSVYVLNRVDGRDVLLTDSKARAYAETVAPKGLYIGWGGTSRTSYLAKGMPQATIRGTSNAADVRDALREAARGWDGKSPKFVAIGVLAWSTTPSDLASVAASLSDDYRVVRGDHFFDLMRAAQSQG